MRADDEGYSPSMRRAAVRSDQDPAPLRAELARVDAEDDQARAERAARRQAEDRETDAQLRHDRFPFWADRDRPEPGPTDRPGLIERAHQQQGRTHDYGRAVLDYSAAANARADQALQRSAGAGTDHRFGNREVRLTGRSRGRDYPPATRADREQQR
jgi:hypothetical protein